MAKKHRIWSFDLGKKSIGEAVRDTTNDNFLHVKSYIMPEELAETRTAASRRRMWRTRKAHQARENWLSEVWKAAGLQPLQKRTNWINPKTQQWEPKTLADHQLEKEFPSKEETTCYTSCLLRIKLLQREKLESWQIYKALHSAIQKRGYGPVPWANREKRRTDSKTEEEQDAALLKKKESSLTEEEKAYRQTISAWDQYKNSHDQAFHFPCYYDAEKMGLWNSDQPTHLKERIDCHAESTRKVRFDRGDVENEIITLARHAAEQLPELAKTFTDWKKNGWVLEDHSPRGNKTFTVQAADFGDFLVYGPAGKPSDEAETDFEAYLKFRKDSGIHSGTIDDWMGATAQKTPRFDNRIVNKCALFSRLQVCNVAVRFNKDTGKPYPDSLLASEVTFLMKLKNLLVRDGLDQRKLTAKEIRKIFSTISDKALSVKADDKNAETKVIQAYALTKSAWGSLKGIKELGLHPAINHAEVKSPKVEGRSRYSRPALRLIKGLILQGQKPSDFHVRLKQREPGLLDELGLDILDSTPAQKKKQVDDKAKNLPSRPWILLDELTFLTNLSTTNTEGKGNTWEDFYIPEQRLDALEAKHSSQDGSINVTKAVSELLGSINDPIVRHRLEVFAKRLTQLEEQFGAPDEIVLEFVREDFMGDRAKAELRAFQNQREKERKEAKEKAAELGFYEKSAPLKYELYKSQGGKCLYCQQDLKSTSLGGYEIEHIVPRSLGGSDAMINYVLAHTICNEKKADQTPYQWKHGREGWDAYLQCVSHFATALRNKKVQLLTREDAPELVQRYTALAETAWVAKLAQKIASLHFGWRNGNDSTGKKRITIISGGFTGRIRRRYRLNSLLNPMPDAWFSAEWEKLTQDRTLTNEEKAQIENSLKKEWESSADKNRKDDRHHALDAMVISFWNTGSKKQDVSYFRFPDAIHKNAPAYFRHEMDKTMPENLFFEKSVLAETIYGARGHAEKRTIVQRVPLLKLAYKSAGPSKVVYDRASALKKFKSIRDSHIQARLEQFMSTNRSEDEWISFCASFRQNGGFGSHIKRVLINVGSAVEYKDLSKDQSGAWRKAQKHKGQIVYLDQAGKPRVRPIYVFESEAAVHKELQAENAKIIDCFVSGCTVELTSSVDHSQTPLSSGRYILNSIWETGYVVVTNQHGKASKPLSLNKLLLAGLHRIK